MKIVIDIPEGIYEYSMKKEVICRSVLSYPDTFCLAIQNGTPVPDDVFLMFVKKEEILGYETLSKETV